MTVRGDPSARSGPRRPPALGVGAVLERRVDDRASPRIGPRGAGRAARMHRHRRRLDGRDGGPRRGHGRTGPSDRPAARARQRRRVERPEPGLGRGTRRVARLPRCRRPDAAGRHRGADATDDRSGRRRRDRPAGLERRGTDVAVAAATTSPTSASQAASPSPRTPGCSTTRRRRARPSTARCSTD